MVQLFVMIFFFMASCTRKSEEERFQFNEKVIFEDKKELMHFGPSPNGLSEKKEEKHRDICVFSIEENPSKCWWG